MFALKFWTSKCLASRFLQEELDVTFTEPLGWQAAHSLGESQLAYWSAFDKCIFAFQERPWRSFCSSLEGLQGQTAVLSSLTSCWKSCEKGHIQKNNGWSWLAQKSRFESHFGFDLKEMLRHHGVRPGARFLFSTRGKQISNRPWRGGSIWLDQLNHP